ncbi:MAG: HEPN domain-containing protein [Butyrivibrio sp.]|nr:HEPN domain-containing protein [Butyrivibrio sp.]
MLEQEHIELSKHRIEKSNEMLKDAENLLRSESYRSANNRAYYCIYHAIRAVIALDGIEFKRHSGNIQYFQKEYVKTGKFNSEDSDTIMSASEIRNASDYDDFYIVSKETTEELVKSAEVFYQHVKAYLDSKLT